MRIADAIRTLAHREHWMLEDSRILFLLDEWFIIHVAVYLKDLEGAEDERSKSCWNQIHNCITDTLRDFKRWDNGFRLDVEPASKYSKDLSYSRPPHLFVIVEEL